jgi:hypothetical protein
MNASGEVLWLTHHEEGEYETMIGCKSALVSDRSLFCRRLINHRICPACRLSADESVLVVVGHSGTENITLGGFPSPPIKRRGQYDAFFATLDPADGAVKALVMYGGGAADDSYIKSLGVCSGELSSLCSSLADTFFLKVGLLKVLRAK